LGEDRDAANSRNSPSIPDLNYVQKSFKNGLGVLKKPFFLVTSSVMYILHPPKRFRLPFVKNNTDAGLIWTVHGVEILSPRAIEEGSFQASPFDP
jgi:hypothetical protein